MHPESSGDRMSEEWRDVEGWEGLYQVSDLGIVRSLDRRIRDYRGSHQIKGQVLKPDIVYNGYLRITLSKNGVPTNFRVSRLVAVTFIPNPDNLPEVDHIDKNKVNNCTANLRWVTSQENVERSLAKNYLFRSPSGELVKIFNLSKFCRNHNLNNAYMCKVHLGRMNQYKGWKTA